MGGAQDLLPSRYYLAPRPLRTLWLQRRLAELLATYRSSTAFVKLVRLLNENHRAAGLPRPTPIEREQLLLDALEMAEVRDSRGRAWRLQGTYTPGSARRRGKCTYLVYVVEDGASRDSRSSG